jgi:hypothetical protein
MLLKLIKMRIKSRFRFIIYLAAIIALFTFQSCNDEQDEHIPYVYVNFSIDLLINNSLACPGYSYLVEDPGYGGVIIYCEYYDFISPGNSIFHAFDATCTNEVSTDCTLINEGNSFYAECPCCGAKYELVTGYPLDSLSLYPLKEYSTYVMNNKVFVKN